MLEVKIPTEAEVECVILAIFGPFSFLHGKIEMLIDKLQPKEQQ